LQPIAERLRVRIDSEMPEHQTQRALRRMIRRKLVMVEIHAFRGMLAPDIDHGDGWIREIRRGRLPSYDLHGMQSEQDGAREKLVFVRASRMGENQGQGHRLKRKSRTLGIVAGNATPWE